MDMLDQDQQEKIKQYLLQNPPQAAAEPVLAPQAVAPVPAPASAPVDWGRILSSGLAGLGDAYSAAAGRQGNALAGVNQIYENVDKNKMEQAKFKLEQDKLKAEQQKLTPSKTYELSKTLEKSLGLQEGELKNISDEALTKVFPQLAEMKRFSTPKEETVPLINAEGKQVGTTKKGAVVLKQEKPESLSPYEKEEQKLQAKKLTSLPKVKSRFQGSIASIDETIGMIDSLLSDPNLKSGSGVSGVLMGKIPGTKAKDIQAKIQSIKAKTSLDALQELRNNSPTGGALGAVSDAEGMRLENSRAALDTAQSDESFLQQLKQLRKAYMGSRNRLENAFKEDYGDLIQQDNSQVQNISQTSVSKAQKALDWAKANPQDPRSKAIANKALAEGAK